jgi:hypothetical protein
VCRRPGIYHPVGRDLGGYDGRPSPDNPARARMAAADNPAVTRAPGASAMVGLVVTATTVS